MTEPLTITDAAPMIRSGELTPSELLEQCLARIDIYEPKVQAWVYLDRERARRDAERLTDEAKRGLYRGPLHGIPVGVKDIIDVFDMPTGCGSRLWANSYARRDATCVERLRQAGALILGKTVTTPYAYLDPPATRNPWNLDRTPGGSSSGSAAAVACGMCLASLGTQTGGSLTRPASYCGVCSLKPTYGRVSMDGVLPLAPSLDHVGVMANCVRDLAVVFQAIAGPDDRESGAVESNIPDAEIELKRMVRLGPTAERPIFVHRLGGLFRERAEPLMWDILNDAFSDFVQANEGRVLHETSVSPTGVTEIMAHHRRVMATEAAEYHRNRFARVPEDYPPRITELIREGLECAAVDYRVALTQRGRLNRDVSASLARDPNAVFLTPATVGPPPTPETTGDASMNAPWSFLGLPTVSFPASRGWGPEPSPPLCIQLTGRRLGEMRLLSVAARFEASIGEYERTMPPVPA